ncbi:MAG: hypothetical protein U0Y68_14985 [Blastocatellia bacterium]
MKQIVKYMLIVLFALAIAGNSLSVIAQRPYRVNDRQVEQLLTRIETRANLFRNEVEAALNRTQLNGAAREGEVRNNLDDFTKALNRLRDRFQNRQSVNTDVRDLLVRANPIESFFRTNLRASNAERDWRSLRADLNTLAQYYNVRWDWNNAIDPSPSSSSAYNNYSNTCLTGTYRLDAGRSDVASQIADRASTNLDVRYRDRVRTSLTRRLEAPNTLLLERNGQDMTIASSRASQVMLTADGRSHNEQNAQGRNTSVMAAFNRDRLTVTTTGDRGNDYSVSFEPLDNCRRLRVTRTISNNRLTQPVLSQSVYEKTSDRAQWNQSASGTEFQTERQQAGFIVANGVEIISTLDAELNTKDVQDGDLFTMTVQSPRQYEGAVIEGTILSVERSGRLSGRAGLNLNFERIRLRNGQTYNFAGTLETARTPDGQTIRVATEGDVQGEKSQTRDTVTRTGIGAALGAIIGAIAGGGKGAAIGAGVGAGVGAGSVIVQGREDLELKRGTEFTIRASAPR